MKSLDNDIKTIRNEISKNQQEIKNHIKIREEVILSKINQLNEQNIKNQQQLQDYIRTQEEVILSKINKFHEQNLKDKNKIASDLEEVKSQQDVLRISYTVNEKQLLEKIKAMIENETRVAVKGKEQEILMKMWINELKDIIANFEKLKKVRPKELALQIDEISNTIQSFKQKLER